MKVLVLGARGMLGRDLLDILSEDHEVIGWDLDDIDITRREETVKRIEALRPQAIVNCAAYTDVDGCETNRMRAFAVNAEGARNAAQASVAVRARLIHLSTDYVFDGSARTPYREDDPTNPLTVYGESKLKGENEVRSAGDNHLILRTAWLYGPRGRNFVEAILNQAEAGNPLRVVNDQRGAPTFTRDLCGAIRRLLRTGERGIFHLTNSGSCTWHEFALEILRIRGLRDATVLPISTGELNRPARRPFFSVLDCSRYERVSGERMRPWRDALQAYFRIRGERTK